MDDATRFAREVGAKRVAKHAEAQRAKGLARIAVWVPVADKDRLIAYAARLRLSADLPLPSDRQAAALLRYGLDPSQDSKTSSPATRSAEKPRRKRKRRSKKRPSDAKPAKKAERTQEQNQPKTPKKRRRQRRRQAEKAARSN